MNPSFGSMSIGGEGFTNLGGQLGEVEVFSGGDMESDGQREIELPRGASAAVHPRSSLGLLSGEQIRPDATFGAVSVGLGEQRASAAPEGAAAEPSVPVSCSSSS